MTVTMKPVRRRRPTFHPLRVAEVRRLTDDAVAAAFAVPAELRETFVFLAGQHLTVRRPVDGDRPEVRRSYSICSTPDELSTRGVLRVGIRRVDGGAFSTFAIAHLTEGDVVDVLPPLGHFTTAFEPTRSRHYAAIAAGSGITPVLSIVATALATEPDSRVTLFYGNRYSRSVMFADELADLKDAHPDRLHLVHVLSREPQGAALLSGRLDAERLTGMFAAFLPDGPGKVDEWFLCGPYELVVAAKAVLAAHLVPDSAVHVELFHVAQGPPTRARAEAATGADAATADVTIVLDGRTSSFTMRRDERLLDAALRVRAELPYACKGGVCSTCRARITEGRVEMARNYALEPDELAAGYVLTCQASPLTGRVGVDYDG